MKQVRLDGTNQVFLAAPCKFGDFCKAIPEFEQLGLDYGTLSYRPYGGDNAPGYTLHSLQVPTVRWVSRDAFDLLYLDA